MAEEVGALRVGVFANVAEITADMAKIRGVLNSFTNDMARSFANFGKGANNAINEVLNLRNAMVLLAGAAMLHAIKRAVEFGDSIGETAEQIGITSKSLQELRFAAQLAGVKQEEFDKSLLQLSKRLGEAQLETNEASKALGRLGISMADVKGLKVDEVFKMVADRIKLIPDQTKAAAIETDLFGKAGQRLHIVLSQGSVALQQMARDAHKMGLILSDDTIKQASDANDEFDKLGLAFKVAGTNIAVGFLPAMVELRKLFTSNEFQEGVKNIAGNFASLVKWMVDHKETILTVTTVLAGMKVGASFGRAFGGQGAMLGGIIGGVAGLAAGSIIARGEVEKLESELEQLVAKRGLLSSELINANDPKTITRLAGEIDDLNKKIATSTAGLVELKKKAAEPEKSETATPRITVTGVPQEHFPQVTQAMTDLTFKTQILNDEFIKLAPGFPEMAHGLKVFGTAGYEAKTSVEALHPQLQQLNQRLLEFKGAQITQEMMFPWEKYAETLTRNKQLFDAGAISAETYARANQKAAEKAGAAWDIAGASIAGSFADIAGSFADSNTEMVMAAKAFSIVQAVLSTYTGMAKALELPFPANLAAAATVAAKGFAFVASIQSQKVPKFAEGGRFLVGGAGGVDSQRITMDLSPGEMVDVQKPSYGNDGGMGGEGSGERTVMVQMQGEVFNRQTVSRVMDVITELSRDGKRMKIVAA